MYLSGARGINADYIFPTSYTGRANNAFVAPDSNHLIGVNQHTSGAGGTIVSTDVLDLKTIDRAVAKAQVVGGGTTGIPQVQPVMVDGEEHYVMVVHPWQAYDLRTNTNTGQWLDIQKAAAAAEGYKSQIFKGALGMYNNVVLHQHKGVIRFSNYGSGSNIAAARALFLGEQAGVCAFGSPGTGMRFDWHEEMQDRGNQVVITTSSIFGIKKTRFNGMDFGVIAVDSAAADPS